MREYATVQSMPLAISCSCADSLNGRAQACSALTQECKNGLDDPIHCCSAFGPVDCGLAVAYRLWAFRPYSAVIVEYYQLFACQKSRFYSQRSG
jgi:hypothetical protein